MLRNFFKKIVIYSQCDLFQTIINHPYMLSFSVDLPFKEGKNGSVRQSLTPIREKLEHISRNLTPCLKFIFEGSACLVTTCLKSFLAPVPYFFYLCASQEKSHCSCYLHSNIEKEGF